MTQNTTTIKHFNEERSLPASDEKIAYKLINMSQVGTPSYIAPELRILIDSHLNFSSVETINEKIKICEKYIYKGDIFSFGCILYELAFLKLAFENRFQLPGEVYMKTAIELDIDPSYSFDLKTLIKFCLEKNPAERPSVRKVLNMPFVESRLKQDFEEYYKKQVIPSLTINTKKNVLLCITSSLEEHYKPIAMKSLKFNQNLIIILAIKQNLKVIKKNFKILSSTLNTFTPFAVNNGDNLGNDNLITPCYETNEDQGSLDECCAEEDPKLFIYNEYGQLLREFNSYLVPGGKFFE